MTTECTGELFLLIGQDLESAWHARAVRARDAAHAEEWWQAQTGAQPQPAVAWPDLKRSWGAAVDVLDPGQDVWLCCIEEEASTILVIPAAGATEAIAIANGERPKASGIAVLGSVRLLAPVIQTFAQAELGNLGGLHMDLISNPPSINPAGARKLDDLLDVFFDSPQDTPA